jgi:hypothetical protein
MQTLKIPIEIKKQEDIDLIRRYQNQYTNLFHLFYNLILDKESLEELKIVFDWKNLKELYDFLKNTKCKYRVSFEYSKVFSNFRYVHVKY